MSQLTTDLRNGPTGMTTIFEDNQSAISMTKNIQFQGCAKHIAIKHYFIREEVNSGSVELKYCRNEDMIANMLTKGLHRERFTKLRQMAGLRDMPRHSACK